MMDDELDEVSKVAQALYDRMNPEGGVVTASPEEFEQLAVFLDKIATLMERDHPFDENARKMRGLARRIRKGLPHE